MPVNKSPNMLLFAVIMCCWKIAWSVIIIPIISNYKCSIIFGLMFFLPICLHFSSKAELFNLQNHHTCRWPGVGGQGNKNKNKNK